MAAATTESLGVPPVLQMISVSRVGEVYSGLFCTVPQYCQSSPVCYLCEHPGICKSPLSQYVFPGCSLMEGDVCTCWSPPPVLWSSPTLIWRWLFRHQSTKSEISPLYSQSHDDVYHWSILLTKLARVSWQLKSAVCLSNTDMMAKLAEDALNVKL